MKITKVSYGQIRNTGNYENCKADVEVEINDGEDPQKAIEMAKKAVKMALYPEQFEKVNPQQPTTPKF